MLFFLIHGDLSYPSTNLIYAHQCMLNASCFMIHCISTRFSKIIMTSRSSMLNRPFLTRERFPAGVTAHQEP